MIRFYFILLVFPTFLFSQVVNIENRRVNDGTYGFSGALDMSLSAQKQKDLLVTVHLKPLIQFKFNGKSDLMYRSSQQYVDSLTHEDSIVKKEVVYVKPDKNKHMLLLINDLKYTGAKKTTYANFGMSHLRYAYRIGTSSWKWETYTQTQYNQLLLQKVRTIVGSGIRTKLADLKPVDGGYHKRAVRIFAGSSLFYEYEKIDYRHRPMETIHSIRWSTYLSSYLNFRGFEFTSSTYVQPNTADFKDVRVSGDYVILMRISEPFSIRINYSHFYDSRPPETVSPRTFSITAGFVYRLDKFRIDQDKWQFKKRNKVKEEF